MPLLAQPPTNPTAAGASRPLNTTHTVSTASHYLLVSHRPPTLCSQLSPPASPAACCVARSARPAACCGALLRLAWTSPAPPAMLVGVGRLLSTLSHAWHSSTRTRQTTGRQRRKLTGCRVGRVASYSCLIGCSAGRLLRRTAPVGVAVSCYVGCAGRCRSAPIDPVPRTAQQHTDKAEQAARTEWRRGGSEGCHGHRSSRSAAAAARSPAVSRRTCTSESRVLVRCIVRARVHAPALMERPRQTPRRWSAPGLA